MEDSKSWLESALDEVVVQDGKVVFHLKTSYEDDGVYYHDEYMDDSDLGALNVFLDHATVMEASRVVKEFEHNHDFQGVVIRADFTQLYPESTRIELILVTVNKYGFSVEGFTKYSSTTFGGTLHEGLYLKPEEESE